MSYDLFLKNTRINWARGLSTPVAVLPPAAPALSKGKFVCTPEEKSKLLQIAAVRKAALSGDRKAQKQWKKLCKGLSRLQKAATKGDPIAQRNLQCLSASKLFASPVAMRGEFVGSTVLDPKKTLETLESFRAKTWKGPYPIVFDEELVKDDISPHPGQSDESVARYKAAWSNLLKTGKITLNSEGRRATREQGKLVLMKDSSDGGDFVGHSHGQKPAGMTYKEWYQALKNPEYRRIHHWRPLMKGDIGAYATQILGGSLNDDESAVAQEGDFIGRYHSGQIISTRLPDGRVVRSVYRPERVHSRGDIGAYATQILGRSLNDDEASVAQEGGSSERESFSRMRGLGGIVIEDKEIKSAIDGWISGQNWNQPGYRRGRKRRGNRIHHLKVLVRNAARNDAGAIAKLDRIKQKLTARVATGDTRATTMLQNIQRWYDSYRGQVTTAVPPAGAPPVLPSTYPAYVPPTPAQTYPTSTYYPAAPSGYVPGADNEDDE